MAAIGATRVTMYDLAEVSHDGEIMDVVFPLTEAQDILKDMPLFEANDISTHRVTRNGALVSGTWRNFNTGFNATKGVQTPIREVLGNLESRLEIDTGILRQERDRQKFLDIQEYAHMEGLSQDIADALVTGSLSSGNHFDGIEARLNSLSQTDARGELTCHSYSGTGSDLMSILIVQWGPNEVHGVYPRGASESMGFTRKVRGEERVLDGNSLAFYAYVIGYLWNLGLVIADDRCVRRVCNIEDGDSTNNLLDETNHGYVNPIIDALVSMKNQGNNAILYMNKTTYGQLWKAQKDKVNVNYDAINPWKSAEYMFDGHPVRFTDSLGKTETAIS